jgi:adenylate kinase
MGTPGAGKGTQAQRLGDRFGACHISTGDALREAVRAGTALGGEARLYMDGGRLVPDDVVIGIVAERLDHADCRGGFVLDGFPRTLPQAQALDTFLDRRGQPLDAVVLIAVPAEDAVRRLAGRRVCPDCGSMFHVAFQAPQQAGRCDRCGAALVQREDDHEETIRHRFDVYARETAPVLEHYRQRGLLRHVDGIGSRDEVSRRIGASLPVGAA